MTLYLSDVPPELLNDREVQHRLARPRLMSGGMSVVTRYGPLHGKRHSLPNSGASIRAISRKGARQRYVPGEELKPDHVHIEQVEYRPNGDYTFPDLVPVMTPGGRR